MQVHAQSRKEVEFNQSCVSAEGGRSKEVEDECKEVIVLFDLEFKLGENSSKNIRR